VSCKTLIFDHYTKCGCSVTPRGVIESRDTIDTIEVLEIWERWIPSC